MGEGGAVLVASANSEGFEILSWHVGHGAVPGMWDEAVASLRLYEYADFQAPRVMWEADRSTCAYEGEFPLRRIEASSPAVIAGLWALCRADPNEEEFAPDVVVALRDLVQPGWSTSETHGERVEWSSKLQARVLYSEPPAGTEPDTVASLHAGISERSKDVVVFRWLLLGVSEALDPGEMEEDHEKKAFVQQRRGLASALVKEGSFQEAEKAYERALDVCRLHPLFKTFFPNEHGELFRGASASAGVQSYRPQLPQAAQDSPLAEEQSWVREASLACYSNLALCALREKKYRDCVERATWVLAAEPQNAKALFRRGTAAAGLGLDLEGALRDLEAAELLQPDDAGIKKEIARVKDQMRAARKAEKAMFKGMLK